MSGMWRRVYEEYWYVYDSTRKMCQKKERKRKEKERKTECDKRHLQAVYVVGGWSNTRGERERVVCSESTLQSKFCYGWRRSVTVSGFLGTLNQIVVCIVTTSGWMGGEWLGQCSYVNFLKNRKDWIMAHPRKLAASQNHHICTGRIEIWYKEQLAELGIAFQSWNLNSAAVFPSHAPDKLV
jgi:hypothetical protein